MTSLSAKSSAFRRAVLQTDALPDLNALFRAHVRSFGFTTHAVGFVPDQSRGGSEPFLLIDWPRAWLELYAREGFAQEDAVVAEAATACEPFTWSELRERSPGASVRIFAAARTFGWNDGLLVPIRLGDEADATRLGVASLAAPTLAGLDSSKRRDVVEASTVAFLRAAELADGGQRVALSERERQVIAFVADGRNDREIAAALGISVSTAHFHVEQAKRKLGAATRAQAVALAAAIGVL